MPMSYILTDSTERHRCETVNSKDKLTPYLSAFQLRRHVYRKPGKEALKTILETAL